MLGKYTGTLGADDSSTLQVSRILDTVAKSTKLSKQLGGFKRLFGAYHPRTLDLSTFIMTNITNTVEEIDDILDAEERRWNDEKSRGWDDKLHGRLVSTIANYKEKARKGLQRDWKEQLPVSWYCVY